LPKGSTPQKRKLEQESKEIFVRKNVKNPRRSGKRSRRVSATSLIVAIAILAIGAATVVSRQKLSNVPEKKSTTVPHDHSAPAESFEHDDYFVGSTAQQQLTQQEAEKMAAGLKQVINQSSEDLVQVEHADGSVSINLDDHFQNVTVARVNSKGSVSESCVDNPQAAGAFFGIDPQLIENRSQTPVGPKKNLIR
jgi:cytoskeletal protein RodZ